MKDNENIWLFIFLAASAMSLNFINNYNAQLGYFFASVFVAGLCLLKSMAIAEDRITKETNEKLDKISEQLTEIDEVLFENNIGRKE